MSLKDNWYIAAEARELKRKPIGVELYGEKLVLFRNEKDERRRSKTAAPTAIWNFPKGASSKAASNASTTAGDMTERAHSRPYPRWGKTPAYRTIACGLFPRFSRTISSGFFSAKVRRGAVLFLSRITARRAGRRSA